MSLSWLDHHNSSQHIYHDWKRNSFPSWLSSHYCFRYFCICLGKRDKCSHGSVVKSIAVKFQTLRWVAGSNPAGSIFFFSLVQTHLEWKRGAAFESVCSCTLLRVTADCSVRQAACSCIHGGGCMSKNGKTKIISSNFHFVISDNFR